MDYSSFVSVKSRHDCHEGMKDGNHSERRSSDSGWRVWRPSASGRLEGTLQEPVDLPGQREPGGSDRIGPHLTGP